MAETNVGWVFVATGVIAAVVVLQCLRMLGALCVQTKARRELERQMEMLRREADSR